MSRLRSGQMIVASRAPKRRKVAPVQAGPKKRYRNMRPRVYVGRRLTPNTTYRYSRYATDPLDIDLNSTSQAYGTEFALQNVKSYSEFSNLYDRFMITGVQMKFYLVTNPLRRVLSYLSGFNWQWTVGL